MGYEFHRPGLHGIDHANIRILHGLKEKRSATVLPCGAMKEVNQKLTHYSRLYDEQERNNPQQDDRGSP